MITDEDERKNAVQDELRILLDVWEREHTDSNWNPDPTLSRISEILDEAMNDFIMHNPDPLDDRHPSKVLQGCNLGQLLKSIFKVEPFINKLVISYLLAKENTERNVLAARLLIGILPGLDTNVIISDADSLVQQLFRWAESSESRELRAYSMALLGATMDAEQAHQYRANNAVLIPVALQLLRELYAQMIENYKKQDEETLKNNFMHGATNFERIHASENRGETEAKPTIVSPVSKEEQVENSAAKDGDESHLRKRRRSEQTLKEAKRPRFSTNNIINVQEAEGNATVPERLVVYQPGRISQQHQPAMMRSSSSAALLMSPSGSMAGSEQHGYSNSSWKNVIQPIVVGVHRLYPLSIEMEQRLILHYLIPTCEYQDNLCTVLESRALEVVLNYLSMTTSRDIRLMFDAVKYTSSLLVHRKFAWQFIATNGVEKLFRINRFSMASTAVGTCLYYLAYSSDIMEKVCHLSDSILNEMVDYALWLLDHSHHSGRASASMFFAYAIQFKAILDRFDQRDGLRRLYNYISILTMLQDDRHEDEFNDDYLAQSVMMIKNSINALKTYLSTHICLKIEQIRRSPIGKTLMDGLTIPVCFPSGSHTSSKPISIDPDTERACIHFLVQSQCLLMFNHQNWKPIDEMRRLGFFRLFLNLLSSDDWNSSAKPETIRLILEFLRLASVSPKVQLDLCETHVVHRLHVQGLTIILELAEGDVYSDPALIKVALEILINCVCGPIDKNVGGIHFRTTYFDPEFLVEGPGNISVKRGLLAEGDLLLSSLNKANDKLFLDANAILRIAWQCAKKNNAIMTLCTILHTKEPPTDADMLREVACRALNGIARYEPVRQILSKLPLITMNELNALMQEPVLLEKRLEHAKFCEQARLLISLVTSTDIVQDTPKDMTQEKLWKAAVVKNTKIVYNEKELLQLMYQHLKDAGLKKTAKQLRQEAKLPSIPASRIPSTPLTLPSLPCLHNVSNFKSTKPRTACTPKKIFSAESTGFHTPPPPSAVTPAKNSAGGPFSLHVKPHKSLNEIVTEYFRKQHATCRNPIATCPPFSLFYPHKCPEPKTSFFAAPNLVSRLCVSSTLPFRCTQEMIRQANRRLVFSRFRHWKAISEEAEILTSCCFSHNNEYIILGNYTGELLWFNLKNGQLESTTACHQSAITSIQQSKHDTSLMLTSSAFVKPYSALWRIGSEQLLIKEFAEECYIDFGNRSDHQLIGTENIKATIFDTETCVPIVHLYDETVANHYERNHACFDPYDELVLNDGVLFDPRIGPKGNVVHKFDKLNQDISGMFHPNGAEVIINSEVWDLRTHRLLHTVPALNQCKITFNSTGDILFGVAHQSVDPIDDRFFQVFNSSFRTFDASNYQVITTVETKRPLLDLCTDNTDHYVAIIETNRENDRDDLNFCKIYEIGRRREADEDDEDQDPNDEEQDEDDFSSSNSSEDHYSSNSDDDDLFLNDDDDEDVNDEEENDRNFRLGSATSSSSESEDDEDVDEIDSDDNEDEDDEHGVDEEEDETYEINYESENSNANF